MLLPVKRPTVPVVDAEFKVVRKARRERGPERRPVILEAHVWFARAWFATAALVAGLMILDAFTGGLVSRTAHRLIKLF